MNRQPLGYEPNEVTIPLSRNILINLAGKIGFEPMNAGAKIQCLTTWLLPNMVSVEGFEPSFSSSQAKRINLPFPHRALVPPTGFEPVRISPPDPKSGVSTSFTTEAYYFLAGPTGLEPATSWATTKCSNHLNYGPILVGRNGIEPLTRRFSVYCSNRLSYLPIIGSPTEN